MIDMKYMRNIEERLNAIEKELEYVGNTLRNSLMIEILEVKALQRKFNRKFNRWIKNTYEEMIKEEEKEWK